MRKIAVLVICLIASAVAFGQENPFEKIDFIIGEWTGTVSDSENSTSKIKSSFQFVKEEKKIEVLNDSKLESSKYFITYDNERQLILCDRFFVVEGYRIKFFLDESLSTDTKLIFISEIIENLSETDEILSGGKARWTVSKLSENKFEDSFEVSFSGKEYKSLRTNSYIKKQ